MFTKDGGRYLREWLRKLQSNRHANASIYALALRQRQAESNANVNLYTLAQRQAGRDADIDIYALAASRLPTRQPDAAAVTSAPSRQPPDA